MMTTSFATLWLQQGRTLLLQASLLNKFSYLIQVFLLYMSTYTQTQIIVKSIIQLWIGGAMDLLWFECLCPSKFLCWNPNVQCKGTRQWDSGRGLGHKVGVLIHFYKHTNATELSSPFHYVRTCWQAVMLACNWQEALHPQNLTKLPTLSPSHEDTVSRQFSESQEENPHQNQTMLALWLILDFTASRTVRK